MKAYIEYDEKTVKYKLMKNLFKLEGSIAYKNLSRNFVMNKNCVSAILMTMVLGTIFLLQYIDMNIEIEYTNPSENWNVTTTSGIGEYTDEAINEIGKISGVDNVYRELVASNKLIVENESVNPIVKDRLMVKFGTQIGDNYSHLNAKVRGINDTLNILVNDNNREETISELKDKLYITGDKLTDINEVKAIMDKENNIIVGRNVVYCIGVIVLVLVSLMSMIIFIVMVVIVTTLIGLIPVSKMKKEVISDLLRK